MGQVAATVYHNAFGDSMKYVASLSFDETEAFGNMLDATYNQTNSYETPWMLNESVSISTDVKRDGGCRSTSVGDRICLVEADSTVHWFEVTGFGFDPIEDPTK